MMNTPAASTSSRTVSSGVVVVHPELPDHQELRDQQHNAGDGHDGDDHRERQPAAAEAQAGERVAGEAVEEDPKERDAEGDDHRVLDPEQEVLILVELVESGRRRR